MNNKEEIAVSKINSEIEEFLEANRLELRQQSITESDINDILSDLKIHINKRIGEIFIRKGIVTKTDIKLVLEELGRSSTNDGELIELQSDEKLIERDQQTVRNTLDNKKDITEIKSAIGDNSNEILELKNALNSFISLIWISVFLLVFFSTIIFALNLDPYNTSFDSIFSGNRTYSDSVIIFLPLLMAIYCITGIYSIWKRKTSLIKQKRSFMLQKILFIAILIQIYAYSYIFYFYYLEYKIFYVLPLILSIIAILSFFFTIVFPPQHKIGISILRSELS